MGLILLEALLALVLLVGIVWWTMFSGRRGGELPAPPATDGSPQDGPPATAASSLPSPPSPSSPPSAPPH
jgi:cytoskeletal protein RodZ